MKVELKAAEAKAIISTEGGVIERYSVAGREVLFPRQEIDGKMRGGSHVCAPYFGPGVAPEQPQHGYARAVDWVIEQQDSEMVVLSHLQADGQYAGLEMKLKYSLVGEGLEMELTARNTSSEPLRLTPGFHPYFVNQNTTAVITVDGQSYETDGLAEAAYQTVSAGQTECNLTNTRLSLTTESLCEFAVWTAHPQLYVCIEPTLAGNSFSEQSQGSTLEYITPGEARSYNCRIEAHPS